MCTLCLQVTIANFVFGIRLQGRTLWRALPTTFRNDFNGHLTMFVSPIRLTPQKKELLLYTNKNWMRVKGLQEGTLIIRLRGMGPAVAATRQVYRINSLTSGSTSIRAQRAERTTRNFLSSSTYQVTSAPFAWYMLMLVIVVWRGTEPMLLMASTADISTGISVPGHPS